MPETEPEAAATRPRATATAFGNIVGVMYNRHYLDMLAVTERGA